jgi:catechol 2,3-dioxygenase-like lactoylglutathione lyase family enzyme
MKLAVAILFARDVAKLRAFYEGVLGLAVVDETPDGDWVRLDAGGAGLALHAIPKSIAKNITIADPPKPRADAPLKLAFHADDPGEERKRLLALGVTMREVKRFGDVAFCDGVDPEGNVFQITTR